MPDDPDASVVIPAYNEEEWISDSLDALQGQDAEVIVVVGGDDGTWDVAEDHPATDRVLEDTARKGWGAALNIGIEAADTEVVCITDADTIVPDDWVARHLAHYDDPDVVGVGGPAVSLEGGLHALPMDMYALYFLPAVWRTGLTLKMGNNSSYRRDPLMEEGGFDEEMDILDDVEMALRMRKHGRVVFDRDLRVEGSTRRVVDDGYLTMLHQYLKGYWYYFIRDADTEVSYH